MNKKILIFGIILSALMISSCVKDLDVIPQDPTKILAGNLGDDPAYMNQALGKIYASFIISGQGANGGDDIAVSDGNFFTTMRALWNLQEITTDEAICAWGDVGIADLNTQTWSPSNPFLTALYQRLALSITYANDFINNAQLYGTENVDRYVAEARFLRALAYYWAIDLFGQFPFTTEEDGVGKFFPEIGTRQEIFNYIESELLAIENSLGAPRFSYPQADQAAAWMLLSRLYLNAEVYTGTPRWSDVVTYTGRVIGAGYSLAPDYRQNFSADNDGRSNPEMIFAWEQDGMNVQGYVGTTFIIESSSDAQYIRAEDFHGLTSNTNWNGNRARIQFLDVMVDTIATYGNVPIPASDPTFSECPDQRVFLKMKKDRNIPSPSASGDYGIGVYKFTARNANGTLPANYNTAYACTDFPVFRLADAYMMRAEALFRLGGAENIQAAVNDINLIRQRAYGDDSGNIEVADLTLDFIIDERAREFYYEAQRRTDLVRFGKFTGGDYLWQWKGGAYAGTSTSEHLNLFPIPGDELSSNPNYNDQNNPGY
ncbi:MAG TPA: RagB/SusD family nutrient uptake outer membrane protein [Bacteroidales bacterium]|nr:RagB/SusD family nutrient uptake outer membrane protein [Bacteroidales bacterium]HPQ64227.1 RagB/SusD family nutrient uptake outer membrane protein [Bacteroidales bacterium]